MPIETIFGIKISRRITWQLWIHITNTQRCNVYLFSDGSFHEIVGELKQDTFK